MALESEIIGLEKLQEAIKTFERINKNPISNESEKEILNRIGVAWTGTIKENIYRGIDYNGKRLLEPKKRDGRALLDTGRLVGSINPKVQGNVLSIGTPVYYSKWVNDGTPKMKPRPYIPTKENQIPDRWWEVAESILLMVIEEDINDKLK